MTISDLPVVSASTNDTQAIVVTSASVNSTWYGGILISVGNQSGNYNIGSVEIPCPTPYPGGPGWAIWDSGDCMVNSGNGDGTSSTQEPGNILFQFFVFAANWIDQNPGVQLAVGPTYYMAAQLWTGNSPSNGLSGYSQYEVPFTLTQSIG